MNDEDIKILEKLLNQKYDDELLNTLEMISKEDEVYILTIFEKQAIKNLIKENEELREKVKELEGENTILKEDLHEMTVSNNHKKENWVHRSILNSYIPVSKIKEKIKELEKEYNEILAYYGNIDTDVIINIPNENVRKYLEKLANKIITLQALLEGK